MKIEPRTLELLYTAIEQEYKWRISELSGFKSLVVASDEKSITHKALVRAGVTLLYAHWEGFIKRVSDLYYEYVTYQNYSIGELNYAFTSIALRREIEEFTTNKKLKRHNYLIELLYSKSENKAHFPSSSPIKTSNLRFIIFEDVCSMIGIDLEEFILSYKRREFDRDVQKTIDNDLVDKRNGIAHGERLIVDVKEFQRIYDIVVNGFLYNFKEVVMDSAQAKKYLRNPTTQSLAKHE